MRDKPCPFCGSDDIRRSDLQFMQAVGCNTCGASVLGGDWNKRTAVADSRIEHPAKVGQFTFMAGTPADVVIKSAIENHRCDSLDPDPADEADARVQLAHFKVMFKSVLDDFAQEFNSRTVSFGDFHAESAALRAVVKVLFTPGDADNRVRQAQAILYGLQQKLRR